MWPSEKHRDDSPGAVIWPSNKQTKDAPSGIPWLSKAQDGNSDPSNKPLETDVEPNSPRILESNRSDVGGKVQDYL